jgi:hypothetical protein
MKTFIMILIFFIAFTSALSGIMMMINPNGATLQLPLDLLDGTIFKDYFIPGILLTALVGVTNFLALFYIIQKKSNRYNWAITGGFAIIFWILIQMMVIHTIYWLHFLFLGIGLLIILIAYQLKGKWAV